VTQIGPEEESRKAQDCEWCEGAKDCPSIQPTVGQRPGYGCTRPAGHTGNHVVCILRHKVAEWADIRIKADES
jgi:hypothetical protein